jgi:hypothetical protein
MFIASHPFSSSLGEILYRVSVTITLPLQRFVRLILEVVVRKASIIFVFVNNNGMYVCSAMFHLYNRIDKKKIVKSFGLQRPKL